MSASTLEKYPSNEEKIQDVISILDSSSLSANKRILFLLEQLKLALKSPQERRYSSSILALCVLWFKISPAAYKFIFHEKLLTLPTERRIQQLSCSMDVDFNLGESTKSYLKARKTKLQKKDLKISVLIDEVYNSEKVEYINGKFFGTENGKLTKTLLCFMIKSVAGKYRDVVAMVPVANLTAEKQFQAWLKTGHALTEIGFDIVLTMTDGNNVNHSFFSKVCGGNLKPCIDSPFSNNKTFIGFDPTHLFKCFYTNLLNKTFFKCPPYQEGEREISAFFSHIKRLYNLEFGKPVRMAYKLSEKMIKPKSIERTNVDLADFCFHESTINALKYYAVHGQSGFDETAQVLHIFRTWFNAVNAKSSFTGQRTRDPTRRPIKKDDRGTLDVFLQFSDWLRRWQSYDSPGLSTQIFKAAILTSDMLVELCNYLLDVKNLDYVLLGHISSDYLESRFGWYRQSSGANYYVSVLQILQSEKSIRIRSLIEAGFCISEMKSIFIDVSSNNDILSKQDVVSLRQIIPEYTLAETLHIPPEDQSIVYCIAGAIVRSILKKLSKKTCTDCLDLISGGKFETNEIDLTVEEFDTNTFPEKEEYIALVTRGGLLKPSNLVYITCIHAWLLYSFVKNRSDAFDLLMTSSNPRSLFTLFFKDVLEDNSSMTDILKAKCKDGHYFSTYYERIVNTFFNLMAKNHVRQVNDKIHGNKKRTFTNQRCETTRKLRKLTSSK